MTSIGNCAFADCSSLSNITIPQSVISIGEAIFLRCKNIKKITNNSSIKCGLGSINIYSNGKWYLDNTDTIVTEISDGQTAVYRNPNEGGTVGGFKYGDINSDGTIDVSDGVILKKHLAGMKGLNINMETSDVNADGEIDIQDAIILLKHLAGINVTLGKQ